MEIKKTCAAKLDSVDGQQLVQTILQCMKMHGLTNIFGGLTDSDFYFDKINSIFSAVSGWPFVAHAYKLQLT